MSNLISGKEALNNYINDRECVLHLAHNCLNNSKYDNSWENCFKMTVDEFLNDRWAFKLKPQTIKISIEVPKPFKPKVGEVYWHLSFVLDQGYASDFFNDSHDDKRVMILGAYRTEAEVIQVRDALRGALNENG